ESYINNISSYPFKSYTIWLRGDGVADKKVEVQITRIESNISPNQNQILSYDILRKALTVRIIPNEDNIQQEEYVTITITYRMKV
ncbi:MAG TPA: hypothetical protein VJ903_05880, partial [Clostridia bacterium]|nr:hypothetical protein [Clostridia bacterium]